MREFIEELKNKCSGLNNFRGTPKSTVCLQSYHHNESLNESELLDVKQFMNAVAYIDESKDYVFVDIKFKCSDIQDIRAFWDMLEQATQFTPTDDKKGIYSVLSLIPNASEKTKEERCMLEFYRPTFWALEKHPMYWDSDEQRFNTNVTIICMAFNKNDIKPYFFKDLNWLKQAIKA